MSKNKPKETIEYVIRLQDKERQLLDDFVMSKNINLVSEPIVEILKDVSAMTTLTIAYMTFRYGGGIANQLRGTYGNVLDLVTDVESVLSNPANQELIKSGVRSVPIPFIGSLGNIENILNLFGGNWLDLDEEKNNNEITDIDVAMTLADKEHPIWKFLIMMATILGALWATDTM